MDDTNTDVIITKKSLVHGLDRRMSTQSPVLIKIGEILKNSIKINEITPRATDVKNTYVLIGAARGKDESIYVASFVVNKYSNEITEIDVLYSANAKKESAALLPKFTDKSATPTDSVISISDLLDYVNEYFPDILPESVLKHFGHQERPAGKLGESALFSERDPGASNRTILANVLESAVQNDIEKSKLAQYKEKISLIEAAEQRLSEIRKQLFSKGGADSTKRKELQLEAKQIANRINIYDRQLLNLEATTALKNVLNREKELARKRQKQKDAEYLKQYKERVVNEQKEIVARYQESRKKAVEGRQKTATRHKIQKVVSELNKLLLRGTKEKHVMIELQKAVAEALDTVNMDTVGAEERIKNLNKKIAKATDHDIIASLTESRDRIDMQGKRINERLNALKDAYNKIKNSEDPLISNSYDEVISSRLEYIVEKIGNTALRDMSLEQDEFIGLNRAGEQD